MERQYKRNHRESYMILEDRRYESDYEETMLRENRIRCLLSFHTMQKDDRVQFWYEITGKQSLRDYFEQEGVTFAHVEKCIRCLLIAFEEMQKYLLEPGRIDLHVESIYMEKGEPNRLYLCYCPFDEAGGITQIMEYLLSIVDSKEERLSHLCYEMYEKSLREGSTLMDLHQMILDAEEDRKDSEEEVQPSELPLPEEWTEPMVEYTEDRYDRWEEQKTWIKEWGQKILDTIRSWIHRDSPERRLEKDLVIEPEPYVCEPTVLLHDCGGEGKGQLLYQGEGTEQDYVLDREVLCIGSVADGNDICLQSQAVSRHHARIEKTGSTFYMEDLNSTNGTSVNGIMLDYRQKHALSRGDRIRFADVPYLFQ